MGILNKIRTRNNIKNTSGKNKKRLFSTLKTNRSLFVYDKNTNRKLYLIFDYFSSLKKAREFADMLRYRGYKVRIRKIKYTDTGASARKTPYKVYAYGIRKKARR